MVHAGFPTHRGDGAGTADAEHKFLLEPVEPVAAVEPVGDRPVGDHIGGEVGVKQQQRDATDIKTPHLGPHDATRNRHVDDDASVNATEISGLVGVYPFQLVIILDQLTEKAVSIEQADSGERGRDVAGRLEVIAGENAEPAGVLRHDFADPELG